jgi:predicted signal transduction protein with EAL and GGDEF domain
LGRSRPLDAAAAGTPGAETLVKAIVDLGRSLRLKTVAEGIEHSTQEVRMRTFGLRLGTGFSLRPT